MGRLPDVVENFTKQLNDLPIQWLGEYNREEVMHQLEQEPGIQFVIMGAGLDDAIRGDLVGIIAAKRPDICIYLKDRKSGPKGIVPFVRRIVEIEIL